MAEKRYTLGMEPEDTDFPEKTTVDIAARQRRAAERILENESLREGLDDSGASALLDWGVACAKRIAADTANIEDDEEADEESYPRMRALRQILEDVKSLLNPDLSPEDGEMLMAEIVDSASTVYGPDAQIPQLNWETFRDSPANNSGEKITALRALLENNSILQGK
jgi:hypothetical protein